jgi:predicted acetyltransferase
VSSMTIEVRTCGSVDELRRGVDVISHYFGSETTEESAERFARLLDPARMHVAWEGDRIVGGAGAFSFEMSVPGGSVPVGGVTVVGVLPTHRRRGILTQLMREQLDDCRRRGDVAAWLWASEGTIYGRYGYGLASRMGDMKLSNARTAFARPFAPRGSFRLVDQAEAARLFPPLYEAVRAKRPGMGSRTEAWWELRRLTPSPFAATTPRQLVLLELDGNPAGYAIYTVHQEWRAGSSSGHLNVIEALAPSPEGMRELWRWLLDFDWTSEIRSSLMPLDHPLFLLLAEARRMAFEVNDGTWVRLVDVGAALSARSYAGDGEVVLEVSDAFLPENAGRWRVGQGGAERTEASPDLELDVSGLGSVFLGGFSFSDLVRALQARELVGGAAERADELFRTTAEPWCPEIF